jgi:quinol monooxygenase YgiN
MSIRVVAHITSKPDTVDQTRELLMTLILPTRIELGCITYQLFQNEADPTDFTFIEEWTSDEDLNAHLQSDHLRYVSEQGVELLASPPDIRRYVLLS